MKLYIIKITAVLLLLLAGSSIAVYAHTAPVPYRFTVVIDAGHGGKDPGAIGRFSKEKNINLSVAKALGALIEAGQPDVNVVYTRKTDVFIPLGRRAEIANKANADLFISIHTNALAGKAIGRGAETYTLGMARADANLDVAKRENSVILVESDYKQRYQGFDPNSAESYIIFEFMQDKYMEKSVHFAKQIQREFRTTGGRADKGVHQAGFLVLRETSMPSVLIELGYISTHDEEAFLNSQNGIKKMSQSIYNAFVSYKNQQKGTAPPTTHTRNRNTKNDNHTDIAVQPIEASAPITQEATSTSTPQEKTKEQSANEEQNIKEAKANQESGNLTQDSTTSTPSSNIEAPVFMVQFLISNRQIPEGSTRFKGFQPVGCYKENNIYKYTYGASTNYNEVVKARNEIKKQFKDAFIVAFKQGVKVNLSEAIKEFKQNK